MYQEKRPTSISVIGWAWIVIGSLMCLSAVMALLVSLTISQAAAQTDTDHNVPAILGFFPLLALIQMVFAILGIVSGVNFLKMKSWARTTLEILSWLLMVFVAGFGIFWIISWIVMTRGKAPAGFGIMGVVMGTVVLAIYGIPLGIMIKYLRGKKNRSAVNRIAEHVHPVGRSEAPRH